MRDKLVERGSTLFKAPKRPIQFTKVVPADELLNDLVKFPHAFVLACIMDQQVKAERAWLVPYKISSQLGGFTLDLLRPLDEPDINRLMRKPEILHRFVDRMSRFFYLAIRRIDYQYGGDASQVWSSNPSSAEVVYRFLQFDGVGPKIACMAANILAREMKVPMHDYFSIDISADIHVRRVFSRLGLCPSDSSVEQVIYKARSLYPEFPGIMDLPSWEIGRNWCKSRQPRCDECYMSDMCPTANSVQA
ncbi:MAG: iron-sulfur cluster loop [bacterium]